MARALNRLTAMGVKNACKGIHQDGGGLALRIDGDAARWFIRVSLNGRRRDIGLGSRDAVSLAEARRKSHEVREKVAAGIDPAPPKAVLAGPMSFRTAAEEVMALRLPGLSNDVHKKQWRSTLVTYAYPVIGELPVALVSSADVLRVLSPIWLSKGETARRVRQRIKVVLDWAVVSGHRGADTANAATAVGPGLPKQAKRDRHHAAVEWRDVPKFVESLRLSSAGPSVRLALEFCILTAGRTAETIEAEWSEIDLDAAVWTIPEKRMKARVAHRVPLSVPALAILRATQRLWPDSTLIFPGMKLGEPLSNMALLSCVRRLGGRKTTHGFRSSFRDWAADNGIARELAEASLAHTLGKIEGAYRRSDLLDARRPVMVSWAAFCAPR